MEMIDLRSDTVTRPTPAMRAAMAAAEVGDDVYGDDPTVNRLEAMLAERFGFESALFFPTGTQSNLCALMSHCDRGDEFLVGQHAHTYRYEQGGAAVLGSIQPQPISHAPDGTLPLADIAAAIKPDDVHFARTRLLALENTLGGRPMPTAWLREATALAHGRGLATHLDGARIWNAMVADGLDARTAAEGFDTASVCLSKGLGTPAGSVLLGPRALIQRARRWRKALGGGMRQSGMLAAAGLHAIEHHIDRLADDHANATRLAEALAELAWPDGAPVEIDATRTNIVFVHVPPAQVQALGRALLDAGIRASVGPVTRLVTHLDVDRAAIDRTLDAFGHFVRRPARAA